MKTLVLGAGIIGVSTAWHLLERGHEVVVVDRQPDAGLETTFANGAQISVSYCEPWADRHAPFKLVKWLLRDDAPLVFRPRLDWQQWRWGLQFLAQCNDAAFARNVRQLVALGSYSHAALKELVAATGIEYQRLERGIAHYYTSEQAFEGAAEGARLMQQYGVNRRVVSREELLAIEPALAAFGDSIVGGTFTPSDESGDAQSFTRQLAARCAARGAQFLYGHEVERLEAAGGELEAVHVRDRASGERQRLVADQVVVALGTWSAPLLRQVGVDLPIYPGKGYSATFPILHPERAPMASLLDDQVKCAISRLGNDLRVAGTIELSGYDSTLDTALARARCRMLAERIEQVFPGVCDTRSEEQGGNPRFWTGLRPATPTNIPYIGRTRVRGLWVNAGHGTLGWTHGAGSGRAMADLVSGRMPQLAFRFYGYDEAAAAHAGTGDLSTVQARG